LWALVASNPANLGPVGVTLWFLALWGSLAGIVALLAYVAKSRFFSDELQAARLAGSLRQGLLVGGVVTIVLALASLRQLSLRDGILIVILAALVEFYLRTRQT
jgi:hypothetical protein